jgi:hypothetical protein
VRLLGRKRINQIGCIRSVERTEARDKTGQRGTTQTGAGLDQKIPT